MIAEVVSVNISERKGEKKIPVDRIVLIKNYGIEGDAHGGQGNRQVSLLDGSSVKQVKDKGVDVGHGDFAENITTMNFDFSSVKTGDYIEVGTDVVLEISQIGKECHDSCEIYQLIGDCVMPREGVFGKVVIGGEIKKSDLIKLKGNKI